MPEHQQCLRHRSRDIFLDEAKPTLDRTSEFREHAAVKAWQSLPFGDLLPRKIWRLKNKKNSRVYRLEGVGGNNANVIAKRAQRTTGLVERDVYEHILPELPFRTLRYFGSVETDDARFVWIFVEDAGTQKYSPADPKHLALVAKWLATFHTKTSKIPFTFELPDRGLDWYSDFICTSRQWLVENLSGRLDNDDRKIIQSLVMHCEFVQLHWDNLMEISKETPRALVHGDFHAENIRIGSRDHRPALLAFDWGFAGAGVPAFDLGQTALWCQSVENPDIGSYAKGTRSAWPHVTFQMVQRTAYLGQVMWWFAFVNKFASCVPPACFSNSIRYLQTANDGISHAMRGTGLTLTGH